MCIRDRHGADIVSTDFAQAGDLSVSDCFEVSRFACQGFLRGDFDEIRIAFTRFVSMLDVYKRQIMMHVLGV